MTIREWNQQHQIEAVRDLRSHIRANERRLLIWQGGWTKVVVKWAHSQVDRLNKLKPFERKVRDTIVDIDTAFDRWRKNPGGGDRVW